MCVCAPYSPSVSPPPPIHTVEVAVAYVERLTTAAASVTLNLQPFQKVFLFIFICGCIHLIRFDPVTLFLAMCFALSIVYRLRFYI